jgi:hypothetical protein
MIGYLKDRLFGRPEVIVDFIIDDGLFFISIKNIGSTSAYRISISFDHPLEGVGGTKSVSDLALFSGIEFLPPGKEIRTFLDASASYFSRCQPTMVTVTVRYRNDRGKGYRQMIRHNLEIYREIGVARRSPWRR